MARKRNKDTVIKNKEYDHILIPDASPLTDEQVDKIAYTVYARFYQEAHDPDFRSIRSEKLREKLNRTVKEVIDSCRINKIKIGDENEKL